MASLNAPNTKVTTTVAIKGLAGSGKSTLLAGLAERFNLIWIDLDNSKELLMKLPYEWRDKINYIHIPDTAASPVGSAILTKAFTDNKLEGVDFKKLTANDIVILDSGTQLSASIFAHNLRTKAIDYKPERDDWGGYRRITEFFASQFQGAQFNLCVTFHPVEAEMDDGRKKLVCNFGSAGMAVQIEGKFGHVIYCDVVNKKHTAFSSSTFSNTITAKSRTDFKIESLPVPSLIPLFESYRNMQVTEPPSEGEKSVLGISNIITSGNSDSPSGNTASNNIQATPKEVIKEAAPITAPVTTQVITPTNAAPKATMSPALAALLAKQKKP